MLVAAVYFFVDLPRLRSGLDYLFLLFSFRCARSERSLISPNITDGFFSGFKRPSKLELRFIVFVFVRSLFSLVV